MVDKMNLFEHGLNLLENKSKKWTIADLSIGIVTAADKNVFQGLQALFVSVKNLVSEKQFAFKKLNVSNQLNKI